VACISVGLLLVMRSTDLWLGDAVMVPIVTVAAGLVVIGFVRPDVGERPWQVLAAPAETSGRRARGRLLAGATLVAFGLLLVAARENASSSLRIGAFATAVTVIGVAVLVGPWLARLAQEAAAERRERIRVQEREAMAAHLHDSVLQTLALIQRTADDPRRTVTLARQQERELRDWLYGAGASARADASGASNDTLAPALRRTVAEVEDAYDVRVELVVVGDAPCDEAIDALVAATREACVNAAKHSGADEVSLYAEVRAGTAEVFVRDRGTGFDRATVAADRRGIAQSIESRLDRVNGVARVDTAPGEGTEWQLSVPVTSATSGPEVA
jgi:signal transduction histidine kinase